MVLLLLSGLVVLLLVVAMALLGYARAGQRSSNVRRLMAQAGLASESGLEYAIGRLLTAAAYPRRGKTAPSRAEEWPSRDRPGTPMALLQNPSFGRSEPWRDLPHGADAVDDDQDGIADDPEDGNGSRQGDETGFVDLDGDGRFTAWTGRLRGGDHPFSSRFLLRIESPDAKLPVIYAGSTQRILFDGSTWALDNLGAILLAPHPAVGRADLPAGAGGAGEPISISWLGQHLRAGMPSAGFRSLDEAWRVLEAEGYSRAEFDAVAPYLDLAPRKPVIFREPSYLPFVNLATASRPVLESIWRYVSAKRPDNLPGEPADWALPSRRAGGLPFGGIVPTLFPAEAGRLAGLFCRERSLGSYSWNRLYGRIAAEAPSIFREDLEDLDADGFPQPLSTAQLAWLSMKSDIAFSAVSPDPYPYPRGGTLYQHAGNPNPPGITSVNGMLARQDPSSTWATWEVDRYPDDPMVPESAGIQRARWVGGGLLRSLNRPGTPAGGYNDPRDPYRSVSPFNVFAPLALSMSPPLSFEAASLGSVSAGAFSGSVERSGFLRLGEWSCLSSQKELETGSSISSGATFLPSRLTGASFPDCGAISLGPRASGIGSARFYWPDCWTCTAAPPAPPVNMTPTSGDSNFDNPFERSGSTPVAPLALPGLSTPPAGPNGNLSLEAWFGPESALQVSAPVFMSTIQLTTRPLSVNRIPETEFGLNIRWLSATSANLVFSPIRWAISDEALVAAGGRLSWGYHVVLAVKRLDANPGGETEFRLFVNGSDIHPELGIPMVKIHRLEPPPDPPAPPEGTLRRASSFQVTSRSLRDLRIYDGALSEAAARSLFNPSRFTSPGACASGFHPVGESGRPIAAQWTGIVPAPHPDPGKAIEVVLEGYRTAPGEPGHPSLAVGFPIRLPASGVVADLAARTDLGAIRSWRFSASLERGPHPLDESPIFESIWIASLSGRPSWERLSTR